MTAGAAARSLHEQRLVALARAQRVKTARAVWKRQLFSGELTVADLLLDEPPEEALAWPVSVLLGSQRHWGPKRVRRLLVALQIGERRLVGELTDRQRRMLAQAVGR